MDPVHHIDFSTSNPLLQPNAEIQKIISQKCSRHPLKNADLLYLKSNVQNPRICIRCLQEDKIISLHYLQIEDVLLASNDSDLITYPVLSNPQLYQVIQKNKETLESITKDLSVFFTELQSQVEAHIEINKQIQKQKIIKLENIQQRYLTSWQKISNIHCLKKILKQDNNQTQIAAFINNHLKDSDKNTSELKQIYDEFQSLRNLFSNQQPNQTKNLICSLLEEIVFFGDREIFLPKSNDQVNLCEDNKQSLPLTNDSSNYFKKELLKKQKEVDQLQIQLNLFIAQIQKYQETNEKGCFNLGGEQNNEMKYSEPLNNQKSNNNVELIIELQRKSQEVDNQQEQLRVCNKQIQDKETIIQELKSKNENQQKQTTEKNKIIHEQQEIINKLNKELRNCNITNQSLTNEIQSLQKQKQVESLKEDLLPGTQIILGNYCKSKKLSVGKNNENYLQFKNDTPNFFDGLSYLDFILKPSTNYIMHVQIEQTKGESKFFCFGLIPDADKDATFWPSGCIDYSEYGDSYGFVNTYLKGTAIRTPKDSLERKSFEMRMNVERQFFRVSVLPNYETVVQINDPTNIKTATPYRLFLNGLNSQSKMTITKLEAVSKFDDCM